MTPASLSPEKLCSLSREALQGLLLRTASVQARLAELPEAEQGREVRALARFLARSVLQMEAELRRRDEETESWSLEELDPEQVVEAA
ncbi:MAG: hypothetical protein HZB56_08035 [Deltaproteobacteria bacterium]|nr:hypothetical protein [Deltaproteobacteria bacterium]